MIPTPLYSVVVMRFTEYSYYKKVIKGLYLGCQSSDGPQIHCHY